MYEARLFNAQVYIPNYYFVTYFCYTPLNLLVAVTIIGITTAKDCRYEVVWVSDKKKVYFQLVTMYRFPIWSYEGYLEFNIILRKLHSGGIVLQSHLFADDYVEYTHNQCLIEEQCVTDTNELRSY